MGFKKSKSTLAKLKARYELRNRGSPPKSAKRKKISKTGKLKKLFKSNAFAKLPKHIRDAYVKRLRTLLYEVIEKEKIDLSNYDATPEQVLGMLIKTVGDTGFVNWKNQYEAKKIIAQLAIINGDLFERLILNLRDLTIAIRTLAMSQLKELNGHKELLRATDLWANKTVPIVIQSHFKYRGRVTDIWIIGPGFKRKWMDFAEFAENKQGLGSFLVNGEIKLPGVQGKFNKQIGEHLARLDAKSLKIVFTLNGEQKVIEHNNLIFSTHSIHRFALTATSKNIDDFDIVFTNSGGYPEFFNKLGLAKNIDHIKKITRILYDSVLQDMLPKKSVNPYYPE